MAVNLGKRNINTGVHGNRKAQGVPTRQNVASVNPGQDPGVAGGPTLPSDFYGGKPGALAVGRAMQDVGNSVIASESAASKAAQLKMQRDIAQREEIEMGLRIKEADEKLGEFAGKVNTRDFSGEGLSPLDNYRKQSQDHLDKLIGQADKEQFTPTFKQEYRRRLESASSIHHSAVAKTLDTVRTTEFSAMVQGDYANAAINNRNDISGWLLNNQAIHEERALTLGQTKANELKQAADQQAVLSEYKRRFDLGDYEGAREALEDNGVRIIAGKSAISDAFNAINKGEIAAVKAKDTPSVFAESIAALRAAIPTKVDQDAAIVSFIQKSKTTDMSKNLKLILGLEVTPSFTQEMKNKAILGVIGKGVDLRSDKDKTKEAVEKLGPSDRRKRR